MSAIYPCPACGFLVFDEPAGSFAICPVCAWEDDFVQLRHPGWGGGANQESLFEYQGRISLPAAPAEIDEMTGFRRDPSWRPLSSEDARWLGSQPDDGRAIDAPGGSVYYWRSA